MIDDLLGPELTEALHGAMVPKFLATRDADGKPNVVPIISLDAVDGHTLVFGEFLIHKTRENLNADPRVAACVVTEGLDIWTLCARFLRFQEGGPWVDLVNQKEMFRYNAYVGISRVAVFEVEAVTDSWKLSKLNVAAELLPLKATALLYGRGGEHKLPDRVSEKFARTQAVKVIAWAGEDGYPRIVPTFSLVPTRTDTLLFGTRMFRDALNELPPGAPVAASVITMDPVAYQVKGVYEGTRLTPVGRVGRIRIREAYSASPPLSGQAIELPDA